MRGSGYLITSRYDRIYRCRPNIFRRVEASTAAVFRDKIFPICLGSQSGAPPLKSEKREGERENSREKKERMEDGKMNVGWGERGRGGEGRERGVRGREREREIWLGNGGKSVVSELKRDVVKLNSVCNIYTRESFIPVSLCRAPFFPFSPSAPRANVTLGYTEIAMYRCNNPPGYSSRAPVIRYAHTITRAEIIINWYQHQRDET